MENKFFDINRLLAGEQEEKPPGYFVMAPNAQPVMSDAVPQIPISKPKIKKSIPSVALEESVSAPVENPASSGFDFSKYLTSPEELEDVRNKQRQLGSIGNIMQSFANAGPSFGEFYLGRFDPTKRDISGRYEKLAEMVERPMQDKQKLLKQSLERPQQEMAIASGDPNSKMSRLGKTMALSGISMVKNSQLYKDKPEVLQSLTEVEKMIPGMSLTELDQAVNKNPWLKDAMSQNTAWMRMQPQIAGLGLKLDNQTASAVDDFDKDPILQNYGRQMEQIKMDKHTLSDPNGVINSMMVSELSKGIANALAGGKGSGFHEAEKYELQSLQRDWAKMQEKISGKPVSALTPEQRDFLNKLLNRLESGYGNAQHRRAQSMSVGRSYQSNPRANQAIQQKIESYKPREESSHGSGAPMSFEEWKKAGKPKAGM